MQDAGVYIARDALLPTTTATSNQTRNGETMTTDGPFAETKEALGGYYLIEADNLDEAIKWGAHIPAAKYGTIEVRPIMCCQKGKLRQGRFGDGVPQSGVQHETRRKIYGKSRRCIYSKRWFYRT
ncbi:MAG: hypothetical protein GY822_17485 [Deltaproteobacteria bacterium]|nr:hypothetical protein [Deltaproteobacteria bacterium]